MNFFAVIGTVSLRISSYQRNTEMVFRCFPSGNKLVRLQEIAKDINNDFDFGFLPDRNSRPWIRPIFHGRPLIAKHDMVGICTRNHLTRSRCIDNNFLTLQDRTRLHATHSKIGDDL